MQSVFASRGVDVDAVVVDNGPAYGRPPSRNVSYFRCPENIGFAAGASFGVSIAALDAAADAVFVLNPDIILGRECLARLTEALAREPNAVVGPALFDAGHPQRYWNLGTDVRWPTGRPASRRAGQMFRRREPKAACDFICGAVLGMTPELSRHLGAFADPYFLYYEDADLGARVRQEGGRCLVVPQARAWHVGGASFDRASSDAVYYRLRNRLLYSSRWNPMQWRGRLTRGVTIARSLLRVGALALRGRVPEAEAVGQAVLDYLRGVYGPRRSRKLHRNPNPT